MWRKIIHGTRKGWMIFGDISVISIIAHWFCQIQRCQWHLFNKVRHSGRSKDEEVCSHCWLLSQNGTTGTQMQIECNTKVYFTFHLVPASPYKVYLQEHNYNCLKWKATSYHRKKASTNQPEGTCFVACWPKSFHSFHVFQDYPRLWPWETRTCNSVSALLTVMKPNMP